jgi:peptide/nickel transport system substrate-binding protein
MTTRRGFLRQAAGAAGMAGAGALAAPSVGRAATTLTVAIFADPLTLDPHLTGNLQGRGTVRATHNRLFRIDAQGRLAPDLAESWEQPDERTYLIHLRQGIKFHDGTPLDAEAVRVNLERIRNPATQSIRGGEISAMDKAEALNARTLKITLKVPFAAFLFPFSDVSGCIASPAALQRWGADYGLHPAGTGPFRLVEYQKDVHTVLERNPDYWEKGKPQVDRVVLRPIPVDSSRLAELRSGGVHVADALPLQDIRRLRQLPEIVVSEKVGFRWEHFALSARPEYAGSNRKFRQAFQWAIDREALHQVVYFGTGSIAYDGILPGSPFHDPEYRPFKHDLERAKRLLGESGVALPATLKCGLQPDPVKQRAGQVFQAAAEKLGVKVEIQQVDSATYRDRLQKGMDGVDLFGWWGYRPDPDQYLYILNHSTGSYARYYGYSNSRMDELLLAERAARGTADRRRVFRQLSELMNEDAVYVSYHYSSDFKGLTPNVKGFNHYQDGIIVYEELSVS